jgi:hypothetical protein
MLAALPDHTPATFALALANDPKSNIHDPNVYRCFAESILFEKTSRRYMRGPPTTLYNYNEAFRDNNTQIFPSPCQLLKCSGFSGKGHLFLGAEGVYECSNCKACLCRFCMFDPLMASKRCFACATSFIDNADTVTEIEMRCALSRIPGTPINIATSYSNVLQMYELYIIEGEQESSRFSSSFDGVTYPVLSPEVFHPSLDSII